MEALSERQFAELVAQVRESGLRAESQLAFEAIVGECARLRRLWEREREDATAQEQRGRAMAARAAAALGEDTTTANVDEFGRIGYAPASNVRTLQERLRERTEVNRASRFAVAAR